MLNSDSVLLLDVMSTLVYDPFPDEMMAFLGLPLSDLMARRHPTAWVDFELGEIDEQTFYETFLRGEPVIDGDAMRQMLRDTYAYLPGIEALLGDLKRQGVPMHALSNYPSWFDIIEEKLELSTYLTRSFVSYQIEARKPDAPSYLRPAKALGVAPERCIFVDDREVNCQGARDVGMRAIRFEGAEQLREALGL